MIGNRREPSSKGRLHERAAEGWAETNLGEITSLRREKLNPAIMPNAPFIGLEDIEPHTSRILKTGRASNVKSTVTRLSAGDVLYSRLRPYLNKVTIPDFEGVASAEILVLQPTAATEAEFVRRRIMTREYLDFAALLDKGDRPRINFKEIEEFPVTLPPLPEQRQIVAKVDGLTTRAARARKEPDRIPALIARAVEPLHGSSSHMRIPCNVCSVFGSAMKPNRFVSRLGDRRSKREKSRGPVSTGVGLNRLFEITESGGKSKMRE